MDVLYFLKDRTRLIRHYCEHAALSFTEITKKSEAGEKPYIPPHSEDGEPPFLSKWIDASELLENRDQHPENITTVRVAHAEKDDGVE